MRAVEVIARKRDGAELSREEIVWFVRGVLSGDVPDYQASAWLMAIFLRGMSGQETADLTAALADSGEQLDLSAMGDAVVDKHSTGGVGDKTTLVVGPLAAACGLKVAKMSGRGLGFSGGTLDKLEAISGFRVGLSRVEFIDQVDRVGVVVAGQSKELAPGDGALYALRDVTATVESVPLIASSIMSKKIAAGAPAICLDVKVGKGAFMKSSARARELATAMIDVGSRLGRRMSALLTRMDEPLGGAIGNALEVAEAVRTLGGRGPSDLVELSLRLTAEMLLLAGRVADVEQGSRRALQALRDGSALAKLREMVAAQGGDVGQIDDPRRLPSAPLAAELPSPRSGYIASIDAEALAWITVELGAGRRAKSDTIDPSVGLVLQAKVGDLVRSGEPLVVVHCRQRGELAPLGDRLMAAFTWSELPVIRPPLVIEAMHGHNATP